MSPTGLHAMTVFAAGASWQIHAHYWVQWSKCLGFSGSNWPHRCYQKRNYWLLSCEAGTYTAGISTVCTLDTFGETSSLHFSIVFLFLQSCSCVHFGQYTGANPRFGSWGDRLSAIAPSPNFFNLWVSNCILWCNLGAILSATFNRAMGDFWRLGGPWHPLCPPPP